jgi:hypothetical protein
MSLKRMLELKGTKRDVLRGGRAQALVGCQADITVSACARGTAPRLRFSTATPLGNWLPSRPLR